MLLTNLSNTAAEATAEFVIDPMNFVENLKYMGTGMLGIFIVMGVIIAVIMLLNKYGNEFEAKMKAKAEAKENA